MADEFSDYAPRLIADLMRDFGVSRETAAAAVGSFAHESARFTAQQEFAYPGDRGALERGGTGWAQWTNSRNSPRRAAFYAYVDSARLDPSSYEANYGFLTHDPVESRLLQSALGATEKAGSLPGKVKTFERQFERAKVPAWSSRTKLATEALGLPVRGASQDVLADNPLIGSGTTDVLAGDTRRAGSVAPDLASSEADFSKGLRTGFGTAGAGEVFSGSGADNTLVGRAGRDRVAYVSPVTGSFEPNSSNIFGASRRGGARQHAGADWHAAAGSPVVASIDGRVVFVGTDNNKGGYGRFVDVLGSDGNVLRYAPHRGVSVKVGQQVAAGDQIGVIGAAPGGGHPHLHQEVIPPGTPAYRAAVKGEFGNTARMHGYVSTIDPAPFFGLRPGAAVTAGQAFDAPTPTPTVQATPVGLARMTGVILAEARGEGPDGMAAVASVIRNRALQAGSEVGALLTTQKGQFAPPMVGGYTQEQYQQAQQIAKGVLAGTIPDPTGGALFFANPPAADPAALAQITAGNVPYTTIGHHVFYGPPGQQQQIATAAPAAASPTGNPLGLRIASLASGGGMPVPGFSLAANVPSAASSPAVAQIPLPPPRPDYTGVPVEGPVSGTLTREDINLSPSSGMTYAEERDAFAQRYANIPWPSLQPAEQQALTAQLGSDAPVKYEKMRTTLPGYAPPPMVAQAFPDPGAGNFVGGYGPITGADVLAGGGGARSVPPFIGDPVHPAVAAAMAPTVSPTSVYSTAAPAYMPQVTQVQPYSTQPSHLSPNWQPPSSVFNYPSPAAGAAAASEIQRSPFSATPSGPSGPPDYSPGFQPAPARTSYASPAFGAAAASGMQGYAPVSSGSTAPASPVYSGFTLPSQPAYGATAPASPVYSGFTPPSPAMGAAAASDLQTPPPTTYTPQWTWPSDSATVSPTSLPVATPDAAPVIPPIVQQPQAPYVPHPKTNALPAVPGTAGVPGFLHHLIQNIPQNFLHLGSHPGGQLLSAFSGINIPNFGGGPLPSGVNNETNFTNFLNQQSWHPQSLYTSSGSLNPSGGSSYSYFSPSTPGGIGGYVTSSGQVYTYPTDPDIYHSVAS